MLRPFVPSHQAAGVLNASCPPDILLQRPPTSGESHRPLGHLATLDDGDILKVEVMTIADSAALVRGSDRLPNGRYPWQIWLPLQEITQSMQDPESDWDFFQRVLASIHYLPQSRHAYGARPFTLEFMNALTPNGQHIEPLEEFIRRATTLPDDARDEPERDDNDVLFSTQFSEVRMCMLELRWMHFRVRMD